MANYSDILIEGLAKLREDIIQASKDAGQQASGRTYQQITETVIASDMEAEGFIEAPSYFYTLIRGRGPGGIPANFGDIIKEWAQYKGITFTSLTDLNRFAYFVGKKMREEGSQLYRNHLYVDIIDTPIRMFEEWLNSKIDELTNTQITASMFPDRAGVNQQGYIL